MLKFFGLLFALLAGCTGPRTTQDTRLLNPPDLQALQPLTAEFRSTAPDGQTRRWQLARNPERVEVFYPSTDISEVWSKTSRDLWFYERVFHAERQIVQYSPLDLQLLEVPPEQLARACAVDPAVIAALGPGQPGKSFRGWRSLRLRGEYAGDHYDIQWLPDLALAVRVKIRRDGFAITTEATQVALAQQPNPLSAQGSALAPRDIHSYRLIDYSDLGDMERDPFVRRIQGQFPSGHHHAH